MATVSVCFDAAAAATALSDRLVCAEPSAISGRVGGRAGGRVSIAARGRAAAELDDEPTVSQRPVSLLARFLTPAVHSSLKGVRTRNGFGIDDVSRSGRVNTDSSVGMSITI